MTDDDRRLAERLRAYEDRVPDGPAPTASTLNRRPPWAAFAAAGIAAVLVGGALAATLLDRPPAVGEASPSASPDLVSATPAATPQPTPAPSADQSAAPSTALSPQPTGSAAPGPIGRWAPAATFSSEGYAEEVLDMTYAAGHFIAIGYREPDDQRGHVGPPIDEPLIWISPDGASWSRLEMGSQFDGAHLGSVVALPDGSAIIYGSTSADEFGNDTPAAWRSSNGSDWNSVALTRPEPSVIWRVADGEQGLLTVVRSTAQDASQLWHSSDGLVWTSVRTIPDDDGEHRLNVNDYAAGPQGFVVTGYRSPLDGGVDGATVFVLASADGVEWFEADPDLTPSPYYQLIAPIHGDWIITANEVDPLTSTWFSTNGLGWERRGQIDVPIPASEFEDTSATVGALISTGERVIVSGAGVICCHGPRWAAGVWSSFDGRTWERLDFPDGTVISAATAQDGTIVLAGFDRAHPQDSFRARAAFWVGVED